MAGDARSASLQPDSLLTLPQSCAAGPVAVRWTLPMVWPPVGHRSFSHTAGQINGIAGRNPGTGSRRRTVGSYHGPVNSRAAQTSHPGSDHGDDVDLEPGIGSGEDGAPTGGADAGTADDRRPSWYARPSGTAWMLLVTGLIGMYGTVALVAERVMLWNDPSHITSCDINPWVSCGQVMKTWQSQLFGFPNQFIGLVAFSIIITIAMALFAGARFRCWYWVGMNIGVFLGFAFCVWLWSQAVYEINILCLYCMVVWAMMIPMFVLLTSRNLQHGVIPAPAGVRTFAAEWSWPIIALLYVGVLASIMLRFSTAFF
jgi:uncharacterized membrane protein